MLIRFRSLAFSLALAFVFAGCVQDCKTRSLIQEFDTNKDGVLQPDETAAYERRAGQAGAEVCFADQLFQSWDGNGNGWLNAAEFPYSVELFAKLANGRDSVSQVEFVGGIESWLERIDSVSRREHGWFKLRDKNSDGVLDKKELLVRSLEVPLVSSFDLNRDGIVSKMEVEQAMLPPQRWRPIRSGIWMLKRFRELDTDRDGHLEAKEMGRRGYLVSDLDQDRDARLSPQELQPLWELAKLGPDAYDSYVLEIRFLAMDLNQNGVVSHVELGRGREFFARLDADSNSKISKDEFQKWHKVMQSFLEPVALPKRDKRD